MGLVLERIFVFLYVLRYIMCINYIENRGLRIFWIYLDCKY